MEYSRKRDGIDPSFLFRLKSPNPSLAFVYGEEALHRQAVLGNPGGGHQWLGSVPLPRVRPQKRREEAEVEAILPCSKDLEIR